MSGIKSESDGASSFIRQEQRTEVFASSESERKRQESTSSGSRSSSPQTQSSSSSAAGRRPSSGNTNSERSVTTSYGACGIEKTESGPSTSTTDILDERKEGSMPTM